MKEGVKHPRAASEHILLKSLLGHHPKKILLKNLSERRKDTSYRYHTSYEQKKVGISKKIYVGLVMSFFLYGREATLVCRMSE